MNTHPDHHGHGHSHTGGHHHHADVTSDNQRRVLLAMALTGFFMVAEVIGGILSGSLALLADAGHMLADTMALGLAWFAFQFSSKPADRQRSYGYHRLQVLAAFLNGVTLVAIVVWIVIEAASRFFTPEPIQGQLMIAIAALGLVINILAAYILHGGDRENLNMRGAMVHVLGDLLGSAGAIIAAGVILLTGWNAADPIISIIIALLILRSAWGILRDSSHILLEGTPAGINPEEIRQALLDAVNGIEDVHHIHAWALTENRPIITLHARITDSAEQARILIEIRTLLVRQYNVDHATIQIETGACIDHL